MPLRDHRNGQRRRADRPGFGNTTLSIAIAGVLFPMQIAYKLMTIPAVGWRNPVVKSNLAIALLHTATLAAIWHEGLLYAPGE